VSLNGWIEVSSFHSKPSSSRSSTDEDSLSDAVRYLSEPAMKRDLDTLMVLAQHYTLQGRHSLALDQLNEAIACRSYFAPALVEKSKVFMAKGQWEQAQEMAGRAVTLLDDNSSSGAPPFLSTMLITITSLLSIGRDTNSHISNLEMSLRHHEPQNVVVFTRIAKLLSRIAGRSSTVLTFTTKLMTLVVAQAPTCSSLSELAYQYRLAGNYGRAHDTYRDAAKIDAADPTAIYGGIYCQIMQGAVEDAAEQLEFLAVVQDKEEETVAAVLFLQALLASRKDKNPAGHLELLEQTMASFAAEKMVLPKTDVFDDYINANPDFMVEIAKEYLTHLSSPSDALSLNSDSPPPPVSAGLDILENVTAVVPALLDAHLVVAKANFEMGQLDKAQTCLNHCLSINPQHSDTYLTLAQLHLQKEGFRSANNCLEQALSYDFKIRNDPVYQLVKSECLANSGSLDEAKSQLEDAMKLPGVRDGTGGSIGTADRVKIFVKLAEVYSKLNMLSEAKEVLSEGRATFEGTSEQIRVLVAISDLAIKKNDFDSAINMLSSVPPDSTLFTHACVAKADIYLKYRHDKQAFAQCFIELVQTKKNAATYVLLGEAYMKIQAPSSAIEAFENALRYNPWDSRLAEKIGRALVSTHDYRKAQEYYDNALRNMPDNLALRYDMAKLYTKLKNYGLAAKTLKKALSGLGEGGGGEGKSGEGDGEDFDGELGDKDFKLIAQDVDTLLLLADVHRGEDNKDELKLVLLRARKLQKMALHMARRIGEAKSSHSKVAANVCFMLGELAEEDKDDEGALEFYNEAIEFSVHEKTMLNLSKLHLRKHRLSECEEMCSTLLRVGAAKEEATMILGDLMFIKSDFEAATVQYRNLLKQNPNNYIAMEKLVSLLRRAGKLEEAEELFKKADENDPRSSSHAGLFYSKGLHARYSNHVMDSVKHFNLARRDGEWGRKALESMIEIYINPDGANLWEEGEGGGEGNSENVRVAEKLLKELELLGTKSAKHIILENFHLLATRQKSNIDRAMAKFMEILQNENDNLPALLGVSTAFMFEKASNKARNYLKRIAKMPYNQEFAEEFETSYLMLAEIYVGRGKFDLAQDLCKKCLGFNRSCAGAWELMGVIMEKEQSYKDAAECYEKSWAFEHEASASIGYKLAFNYLKAKRYVEAIDISNKVLSQYPEYPKIKKDILERAMYSLRP